MSRMRKQRDTETRYDYEYKSAECTHTFKKPTQLTARPPSSHEDFNFSWKRNIIGNRSILELEAKVTETDEKCRASYQN